MDYEEILEKLREQTAKALDRKPEEIRPEQSLVRDLGAESIDLIDLSFRIEKAFGIEIQEGELFDQKAGPNEKPIDTVGKVAAFIADKMRGSK